MIKIKFVNEIGSILKIIYLLKFLKYHIFFSSFLMKLMIYYKNISYD